MVKIICLRLMRIKKMTKLFSNLNAFDLSFKRLMTCHEGYLNPCFCKEVVPGDIFKWKADLFMRLMPLVSPMYQDVNVYLHMFYVPNRIIWPECENYYTGGRDGNDTTVKPYIEIPSGGFAVGSLADYLGIPTGAGDGVHVSALPFRAYQQIYNDWYRDNNLISEVTVAKTSGQDTTTVLTLQKRAWSKDIFTSSLPWAQRGDPVYLPLGTTAPVIFGPSDQSGAVSALAGKYAALSTSSGPTGQNYYGSTQQEVGTVTTWSQIPLNSVNELYTDLSTASAASINDIRVAFQMQRFMEKNARGGARYIEWLLNHFGVRSSDARLQRAEYLGGGKCATLVTEILQTSETTATSPQGNMAGRGIAGMNTLSFQRRFEEYGWVIGIVSVMPKASYSQGLKIQFCRENRYEEYLPVFAHLGNQEMKNKHLYLQASTVLNTAGTQVNEDTFGYQERNEELRRSYDEIAGQFRTTLKHWHQGRIFASLPTLSKQFIECTPDKRVFAVTDPNEDECLLQINHHLVGIRPVPKFGSPGLIDHD